MSLSSEWKGRLGYWEKRLKEQFYLPLGELDMKGFVTLEQLSADEAAAREFVPMPAGTRWGAKWEYGWFKAEAELPPEAMGKRIVLDINLGGEAVVFIGRKAAGNRRADWVRQKHHFISDMLLCGKGLPGKKYEIVLECYAGHGERKCDIGPVPPETPSPYEPEGAQAEVGKSTYGIWNEAAYQLWLDMRLLLDIRNNLDPGSLRTAEIDRALKDFTLIVDFELPYEQRQDSFKAGRERLKPLLECRNGSTAPVMYMFGHSHIDVAWLWPLAETERKCARTFSAQLAHLDEYPEYIFLQSQPHLYDMTKKLYPELYGRIKEKVREGRFIPEGGMWVEADTNISGGESLIRQFLHGLRFFKEEFGVKNELLWLPDVFGYSAALPQIMKGCGIKYFSTQKIFWDYNDGDPFPYNYFIWQGMDGSEVVTFIHNDYNSSTTAEDMIKRWNERAQKEGIAEFLVPFGYGDGGGGPSRDHIENIRRLSDVEGAPKAKMSNPLDFFKELEAKGRPPENKYVGELYFQAHRGVLTSQAKTKRGNRKSEMALREAELWGTAARALAGYDYPAALMDAQWKSVLLNQFHDILPGSSIARVYEEAESSYDEVLRQALLVSQAAADKLCTASGGITVFNSLSWDRKELVKLPEGWQGAADGNGGELPVQDIAGELHAEVPVPSCGWTAIKPGDKRSTASGGARAGKAFLENEHLRVQFNGFGEISGILDRDSGRELAAGPCNSMKMYGDVPRLFDAWDIDSMYELSPVELREEANIRVLSEGPLAAVLVIERRINNSFYTQTVSLRSGSRRIDFSTSVDWRESHKLLKVSFPVNVHAEEAIQEIQFGHVKRPTHRSRRYDADRFEVCNHKWTALAEENRGAAVLNDCKYGVSVSGGAISLTLLRSAKAPDFNADIGRQEFTYSFYAWNGPFMHSDVVREAYALNCPVLTADGDAGQKSLFTLDADNVILETVKPAEDGSDDIVVRLYESKRTAAACRLETALPFTAAEQTDMLEAAGKRLPFENGGITLEFRPFEIKTVRFKRG